jgi:hypothetical protein
MVGGSDRDSSLIADALLVSLAIRQLIVAGGTDGDYWIPDGRHKRFINVEG